MTEENRIEILNNAKDFFRSEIVTSHIEGACKRASKLSEYNVNPFLFKYLANFLTGNDNAESIARALVLPRILGSSINTSFGMKIQKLIGQLFQGLGSTTTGIDIEFIDAVDGRKMNTQELNQLFNLKRFKSLYFREARPGEVGCTMSHQRCFQAIIDQNLPYALLLEDDAVLGDVNRIIHSIHTVQNWLDKQELPTVILFSSISGFKITL